jgi:methylase of polypeptide subunit release factors
MLHFARVLPGELDGTINPADYGFDIIPVEVPASVEADLRVAQLYRQARATAQDRGVDFYIPAHEQLLTKQPYDPEPARKLVERHRQLTYPYTCEFGVAELEIDEGVFCPTLTNASPFLLKCIDVIPGERVLDAFAGSGAFGVHAALSGAERVVSFDTSSAAVGCTQKNAMRNNVHVMLDARRGTLQETIAQGEMFDLIIANPPLIPGEPVESLEEALFDSNLQATVDFVEALPRILDERGRCYLLTSDVIDRDDYKIDLAGLCQKNGLKLSTIAQLHREYESYRVHKITHRGHWLRCFGARSIALAD